MGLNLKKKLKKIGGAIEDLSPDPVENLVKRTGSDVWAGANYTSNLGAAMLGQRFARPVDDGQGGLKGQFSLSSVRKGDIIEPLLRGKFKQAAFGNQPEWNKKIKERGGDGADSNNPLKLADTLRHREKYYANSNLPEGVKAAGYVAADPTMYIPAGIVGKLSTKTGVAGTKIGKLLLGAEGVGATSRSARIAGGLLEGAPRLALPIAAGVGLGTQAATMTGNKFDDALLPLLGGAIGAKFAGGGLDSGKKLGVRQIDPEVDGIREELKSLRSDINNDKDLWSYDDVKRLDRINELKDKLAKAGAPDTGFPTRMELLDEQRQILSEGRYHTGSDGTKWDDPVQEKRISDIGNILENYDDLKRIYEGATDTSAVGLSDMKSGPDIEIKSDSIEDLAKLSDNSYMNPRKWSDRDLVIEYQRTIDWINSSKESSNTGTVRPEYIENSSKAAQMLEAIQARGLDPTRVPSRPLDIFDRSKPEKPRGIFETSRNSAEGSINDTYIRSLSDEELQKEIDTLEAMKKDDNLSDYGERNLEDALREQRGRAKFSSGIKKQETGLENISTEELQSRLGNIARSGYDEATQKVLSSTIQKELANRGVKIEYPSTVSNFVRKLGKTPENIVDSGKGKAGLLRVIEDSNLSPEAKAFSTHFVNSIPEKYVDMLRTLFVVDDKNAMKSGTFGVYTPDSSTPIMRIYADSIKAAENAPPEIKATYVDRVVAHELAHHLQSFMTTEDLNSLVKLYDEEYANASRHADDLLESGNPTGQMLRTSQAEATGYRFTNFNEWFAEKMTDAAHEQWRTSLPKSLGEKIKQLVEVMHDISAAIFGFSSAKNTDEFKALLTRFQAGEQQTGRNWVHIGPPASEYRSAISDTDMAAIGKMIDEGVNPQASIPPGTELDAISGTQPGIKQGLRPKFKPGENMRKVSSSASAKAANLPIVGNLTKAVRQNVQRVTERQGAWIKATDLGEAPANYGNNRETVNFLTRSARTLNRQVESGKNVLSAQAQEALSAFKIGADGFVKNVKPSAKDVADGIKNPSFYRIVDFANEYALTKQQKEALKTFTTLADQVAAEKALHGMELPQTQAPQGFFASRGVQVNRAVEPHDFRRKITNEAQNSREFKDPNDFIKAGGKYEKPLTAFSGYVENHFKDIANRTMQDLLDPLGSEGNVKGYALPMEIAPSLQGKTFDKRIAQAMIDQYSNAARLGGMSLSVRAPLIRGINSALLPIKITLDMGASLINQGGMAYSHPGAYIKNMALTTRDMFNQKAYHEWLKSDKVKDASAHGVSLHFEPSQIEDYAAGTLLTKGKYNPFRPLAEHFTILNNRMRVDTYNSVIEVNRALGNELDDTGKEAVARAINRFTGISEGRATDLEQTLMFAPNFFRSQIENVKLALTSGSIDGQLARKYMSNYLTMSGVLAYSTAALQGRDPSEVMSPIDLDKFRKDGVIALNPNFYTVRIMDQDVRLLGPYTTLAGIMMGAVEAASLSYKDPQGTSNYLEDYLLRLANTKGAPVTSMAADVKRGETITRVPVNSPEYLFRQVMPISLGQIVEPGQINSAIDNGDFSQLFASSPDGQQLTWEQKLFGGVMNFLGGNTSQKSGSELREQRSQSMFGKGFDELNNEQKRELFNTYPITRDNSDPLTKMYNDIDAVEVKFIDDLNEKQALVESGAWSKQDFREWYKVRNQERIVAVEQARISSGESEIHRYGFTGTLQKYLDRPKNLTPEDKAVKDWYALTDRFIKPEGFDYDGLKKAREDFLDNLSPEIYGYVTRNTKPTDPTGGIVDEMKAAQDKVSKYFEAEKIVYDKFSTTSPLMKSFGSPEGIDKFINTTAGKLGLTPATTVAMMEKAIPEFKVYNSVLSEYQRLLRLSDPNMDKALTDWYGFEPANRFGYILSQYGTDAGYTLNPAIAENKGLNDRSSAYNFALEQYVQGKLKSKPRYSLIKSNRLEE